MKMTAAARLDRATVAALVAAVLMPVALGLIFFYVPNDADQGFSQRIFYFHVPIALTTYALFGLGRAERRPLPVDRRSARSICAATCPCTSV